jgi:hypothetical protein
MTGCIHGKLHDWLYSLVIVGSDLHMHKITLISPHRMHWQLKGKFSLASYMQTTPSAPVYKSCAYP